jgi:hypothetical protein
MLKPRILCDNLMLNKPQFFSVSYVIGALGGSVVKALRYKPAGRGFDYNRMWGETFGTDEKTYRLDIAHGSGLEFPEVYPATAVLYMTTAPP